MSSCRLRRLPWLVGIAVAVILADRLSKLWVLRHIPYAGAIPVIPNLLRLTH